MALNKFTVFDTAQWRNSMLRTFNVSRRATERRRTAIIIKDADGCAFNRIFCRNSEPPSGCCFGCAGQGQYKVKKKEVCFGRFDLWSKNFCLNKQTHPNKNLIDRPLVPSGNDARHVQEITLTLQGCWWTVL